MPPRPPHERHVPSSAISAFIDRDRVAAALEPLLPDDAARDFVVRCILEEGPAHHRGANYVLVALLERVLSALPPSPGPATADQEALEVPMRLPPHLARTAGGQSYPLRLPVAPLEALAARGSRDFEAMVDCLTDGPPHHALANVAMVALLGEVLARLESRR